MKRINHILLFFLCLSITASGFDVGYTPNAVANMTIINVTGVPAAAGGGLDDCSGDLKFSWHMESTTVGDGTDTGCSDGDTTATASSTPELSTVQYQDGAKSMLANASSERYEFDVSSNDIIDEGDGKIILYVYVDVFSNYTSITRAYADGNNDAIRIEMSGDSANIDFQGQTERAGTYKGVTVNSNRTEDEWIYVEYRWATGVEGNDHYIKVCDSDGVSNCITNEEDDDTATISTPLNTLFIGCATGNSTVYVDNIKIYGTSGY